MFNIFMATNEKNQTNPPKLIGDNIAEWGDYMVDKGPEAYRYRRLYEATLKRVVVLETYIGKQDLYMRDQTEGSDDAS
jgi:hypothetical protein